MFVSENCPLAPLLLVVVLYLAESTKLQTVDKRIKIVKQVSTDSTEYNAGKAV